MRSQRITPRRAPKSSASHRASSSRNFNLRKQAAPTSHSRAKARDTSARYTSARDTSARYRQVRSASSRRLSVKRIILTASIAVASILLLGLFIDIALNFGKIHRGVTLQGIPLGGLTREEAELVIAEQITAMITDEPIDLFPSAERALKGIDEQTFELFHASTNYDLELAIENATSWRINTTTISTGVDAAKLAEKAYRVGRGADFFTGRLKAGFMGVDLTAELSHEILQLESLVMIFNSALGTKMRNADIRYEDGVFVAVPGAEGYEVDHEVFVRLLDQAFLGGNRSIVIPMRIVSVEIKDEEAQELAKKVQQAMQQAAEQPIILIHNNTDFWEFDSSYIIPWIVTTIERDGKKAKLTAKISETLMEPVVHSLIGDRDPGIRPIDASFKVVDGKLMIVPGINGTCVDYVRLAEDMSRVLFSDGAQTKDRSVQLKVTSLEPSFSTKHAEDLQINDMIASFTTTYYNDIDARINNIHLVSDLLNNSLIAPGGIWSYHDTAGYCSAERGFLPAGAIINGQYVDQIGGGLCQVATTVYNTVLESGLPVVERVFHSLYPDSYPAGRDATVSYRWPDLKFQNDTENWILLTMSYTNDTVTCTLWGTNPGYVVKFEDTGFYNWVPFTTKRIENPDLPRGTERVIKEGLMGRTIVVTRYVYNKDGELIRKADFKSVYDPEFEIIEVGTK